MAAMIEGRRRPRVIVPSRSIGRARESQQQRAADPADPAAAGDDAAGHRGQPEEREDSDPLGTEADDQHGRQRRQRFLEPSASPWPAC